jgi:hypothetical protein
LGGTYLIPNSVDNKKVLIDRGLNLREEVTDGLDVADFVEKVTDFEMDIAKKLGAGKIVVPLRELKEDVGTNNFAIMSYYDRKAGARLPLTLDIPSNFNKHDITKGSCVVFREIEPSSQVQYQKLLLGQV